MDTAHFLLSLKGNDDLISRREVAKGYLSETCETSLLEKPHAMLIPGLALEHEIDSYEQSVAEVTGKIQKMSAMCPDACSANLAKLDDLNRSLTKVNRFINLCNVQFDQCYKKGPPGVSRDMLSAVTEAESRAMAKLHRMHDLLKTVCRKQIQLAEMMDNQPAEVVQNFKRMCRMMLGQVITGEGGSAESMTKCAKTVALNLSMQLMVNIPHPTGMCAIVQDIVRTYPALLCECYNFDNNVYHLKLACQLRMNCIQLGNESMKEMYFGKLQLEDTTALECVKAYTKRSFQAANELYDMIAKVASHKENPTSLSKVVVDLAATVSPQ
ncbi:hypothetical protein CYMTET_55196 [Cymbomonas tetramitiformis]|uniref:Uncharacterized protein n=1 Tax=Cymbomonas tetramitiformis TaxID=36881 RepID=A0AAE0BDX4_9CHLO|nr:hypothetical protein CYMTET_55196 [Cymbomonas tetramitiformis]|eukprot:gene96-143_t